MKYKVYISINGELHERYEPKKAKDNDCSSCSLKDYCANNEVAYHCSLTTIFKKVKKLNNK